MGETDRIERHHGTADRHLAETVRTGARHPPVRRIVSIHDDVEALSGEIRKAVLPRLSVDVVPHVGRQEGIGQQEGGIGLPDHGDGAAGTLRPVGLHQGKGGRILDQLLHVRDGVTDGRGPLPTGDGGEEKDRYEENQLFHKGHIILQK